VEILWVTAKRFGADLAKTTQLAVSNSFAKQGWGVIFVAPDLAGAIGDADKFLTEDGPFLVDVKRSKRPGLGWITFGKSLKSTLPLVLRDNDIEVALVEWQAVAGSYRALNKAGIPWLIVDRSPPVFRSLTGRLQWFEYRRAYKIAAKKGASGSVLKSKALAEWHQINGRAIEPVTILEAGVEVSRFKPTEFLGTPSILHHGQLDAERDIEKLVEIGKVLHTRGIEFDMLIAGAGNRLTELQEQSELHDWLWVFEALKSEEIPAFIERCHIALFPLPDTEIWGLASPLKVREWAATGLPMILSDITPHRSIGERNWAKLIRPDATVDEWADAVIELLDSDLHELGAQARTDAETEFDWEITTRELVLRITELGGAK